MTVNRPLQAHPDDYIANALTQPTLGDVLTWTTDGWGSAPIPATPAQQPGGLSIYGDGSDGVGTMDGATTVAGMAPAGNTYTLARDVFFSSLTISAGVFLERGGFRVFVQGALINNGTIRANGAAGGGGAAVNGSICQGATSVTGGGAGQVGAGTAGGNVGNQVPGGSAGGAGGGVAGNGGAGGTTTVGGTQRSGSVHFGPLASAVVWINQGNLLNTMGGGAGGGGGGGDGANAGGNGGGGGGIIMVAAKTITGTGAIQCRGSDGTNAGASGNRGGGGGGGGGTLIIISSSVVSAAIAGQTIDCNPGAGGTGFGTGTAGTAGTAGTVILIPN